VRFKIKILKCAIWKKWFLKTQLSVRQNRSLAFKILNLPLKFCIFKKASSYLRFEKTEMQFPNDLCSTIWFKIALIVYEIAIPNAPLKVEVFLKQKKNKKKNGRLISKTLQKRHSKLRNYRIFLPLFFLFLLILFFFFWFFHINNESDGEKTVEILPLGNE